VLSRGLADAGLKQERRALRLIPENLRIKTAGDNELMVEFSLPTGAFATSVLREMVSAPGL
jgi:tRNA pseudouridine13 synthase